MGSANIVRNHYDNDAGWVTRTGISSVCWLCDQDVYEHKPAQAHDVWRCKACETIWEEPHR